MTESSDVRQPGVAETEANADATPLQAVILDFDGLILDTESPVFELWRDTFRQHGHDLGLDLWQHALGTFGGFDPAAHLAQLTGLPLDCDALRQDVRERNLRRCQEQELLPGIVQLLEEARDLGLGTAVASSSTRGWVEGWLERHQIASSFDAVCGRDDVREVKPAPELFLLAAERLGAEPRSCLVFEDSPNGLRAARAAGMRCVAVPNAITRGLPLPDPDLVLTSAGELPLAEIARRVGLSVPASVDEEERPSGA
jgi:HAD superfamily hydrolase (TIGR01509 family)